MRLLATSSLALLLTTPAFAQTTTATGVGTGISSSRSNSAAAAISGQGGSANSAVNINSATIPTATTSTINNTGTQTVRNVPTVFAPSLSAAGLETCLGSISGGVGVVGTGVTFGTSIPDAGCATRLDARTLWSFGLKKAAIARLCLNPDIYNSMPEVCVQYMPQYATANGYAVRPPVGSPIAVYPDATSAAGAEEAYMGGPVEVVMRNTGVHRMCADFDTTRHRCRAWVRNIEAANNGEAR